MNKKVLILLAVLLLLISGIVYVKGAKKVNNNEPKSNTVFTSIKDAISKDISLVCEFKDENGGATKSHIKNGAVRISTDSTSQQDGEIIIKDKKMYMWDTKAKEGFVYDIPDAENSDSSEVVKSEAYLDMLDKYKDSCKVESVEDSYFVAPTDIKFQDMNKFLEELKSQMPQIELPNQ